MNLDQIKETVNSSDYEFLRTNSHLGDNIVLLGLGGSHAYGTDVETSDLDIRGCALETKFEILTNSKFEQVVDNSTDTTIYSFNKLVSLLSNCNPNVIELLGLKPEHYLYISDIGRELLDNKELFLSQIAVNSFGGYATAQLRRLDNKSVRQVDQAAKEQHILNSINTAAYTFKNRYFPLQENDSISLYLDTSAQEDLDKEIFMDIHLTHYPLRDYKAMWSEMNNIVKDYSKLGARNTKAIEHGKLGKHMMHTVRLYFMAFDILERKEIITYREAEHEFLMDIRNGKYLDSSQQPLPEFFELVDEFEKRLKYAAKNTDLRQSPNYKKIKEFIYSVYERVVKETI